MDVDVDEAAGTRSENNQSIFEELLGDSEGQNSEEEGNKVVFYEVPKRRPTYEGPLCEITENDRILSCGKNIVDMCCTEDILVLTCTDEAEGLVLLVYSLKQPNTSNSVQEICCKTHQIHLPACTGYLGARTKLGISSAPKMFSMIFKEDRKLCDISCQLILPSHLFSLLFGWETVVRSRPVLVCCLKTGELFFHPADIASLTSTSNTSWQQLCTIDTDIVAVFHIKINRNLTQNESIAVELQLGFAAATGRDLSIAHTALDALLVVGSSGKCCVMTAVPVLGSDRANYRLINVVFVLPNTVTSCCMLDGSLVVSTEEEIVKHNLMLHSEKLDGQQKQFKVEIKTESLRNARISEMWILSETEKTLILQTALGELIDLNLNSPAPEDRFNFGAYQPSMKDLLLGINVKQTRLDELKSEQECLNDFLQQMNIASRLLQQEQLRESKEQQSPPVTCTLVLKSEVGYSTVEYFVVVTVTNQSPVFLSKGWGFSVSVAEANKFSASCASSTSYSTEILRSIADSGSKEEHLESDGAPKASIHRLDLFRGLKPGKSASLKIPVAYSPSLCGFDVRVHMFLHRSDLVELEEEEENNETFQQLDITMAVLTVDLMHFLHLSQPDQDFPFHKEGQKCHLANVDVRAKQSRHLKQGKESGLPNYSVIVKITSGNKATSQSPMEFLRILLSDSQVEVPLLSHPACTLHDVCGNCASVTMERTNKKGSVGAGDDDSGEGDGEGRPLVITMKSCSLSFLAKLRMAVLTRIGEPNSKVTTARQEDFFKTMRKIVALEQQLDESNRMLAAGMSASSSECTLKQLYSICKTLHDTIV